MGTVCEIATPVKSQVDLVNTAGLVCMLLIGYNRVLCIIILQHYALQEISKPPPASPRSQLKIQMKAWLECLMVGSSLAQQLQHTVAHTTPLQPVMLKD